LRVINTFFLKGVYGGNFYLRFGCSQHLFFEKRVLGEKHFIYGLAVANTFFFVRGFQGGNLLFTKPFIYGLAVANTFFCKGVSGGKPFIYDTFYLRFCCGQHLFFL